MEPTPSDVTYLAVLKFMIISSRNPQSQSQIAVVTSFQLLTFLADNINGLEGRKFSSFSSFSSAFRGACSSEPMLELISEDLATVKASVNNLFQFIESAREIFVVDKATSPNEVPGPTSVGTESPLGMFARTVLAKWENLSFEGICFLYENIEEYMINPASGDRAEDVDGDGNVDENDDDYDERDVTSETLPFFVGQSDAMMEYSPASAPLLAQRQHLLNAQRSMLNGEKSKST
jgi:hypothetical protein